MSVPSSPSPDPKPDPLWKGLMLRYFYNPLTSTDESRGERFVAIAVKAVKGALHVGFSLKSDKDTPDKSKARFIASARAQHAAERPDVYRDGHCMVKDLLALIIDVSGLGVTIESVTKAIRRAVARQEQVLLGRGGSYNLSKGLALLVSIEEPWVELRRDLTFFCRRNSELLGDWAKALPKPESRQPQT